MKIHKHALIAAVAAGLPRWPHRPPSSARPTSTSDDYPTVAAVKLMSERAQASARAASTRIKVFNNSALGSEKDTHRAGQDRRAAR